MMDSGKKKGADHHQDDKFAELIFSWSIDDILNEDLYKYRAEKIPLTFQSEEHYFSSFVYPFLEETRTELASSLDIISSAPFAEIFSLNEVKAKGKMLYDVTVGSWRNRFSERGKEPYRTLPGDLCLLMDGKPDSISDLQNLGSRTWAFSLVNKTVDDDNEDSNPSKHFKAKLSHRIDFQDGMFVVFLMNITTQKRIWNSLHMHKNLNIIKEVIYADSVVKECDVCSFRCSDSVSENVDRQFVSRLNESQIAAITASINKTKCCHNSSVGQIWGPPGTGKTTTVSVMLFMLLKMDCRMLACAPTNVAIVQLASRVLNLVRESFETRTVNGDSFYPIGDVLLFGNMERLKVGTEIEDIYVEHRVDRLTECLGSLTGWKHCIRSMIDLLENCVSQYHVFVENDFKEQLTTGVEIKTNKLKVKPFIGFLRDRFKSSALPLRRCILTLCTHISRSFMQEDNFQISVSLLNNISSLESLLFQENLVSEELEKFFSFKLTEDDYSKYGDVPSISSVRNICCSVLRTLQKSLERLAFPSVLKTSELKNFCFEQASLIFCTTSTSYKLHTVKMEPLNLLVIDEAAQLKEAESTIPFQLPGVNHAILIGDECQLPAMVKSQVSTKSGFGRSLFERLSSLGHSKHLLNIQYRMHPSISFFPNYSFYENQILDAEDVACKSYEKRYLSGPMFGSYSFINVVGEREEKVDDDRGWRNMVEVALVMKIVQNLYRACNNTNQKLSVGVVSPYVAQVLTIQEKLAHKYEKLDGFSVKVKSIDGFQGGEEDVIILSTVRSNSQGSVGFLSSHKRTNVALTRARHSLWILGNERTLASSESIWKELVCDARNRNCLFNADADECLKMTIVGVKKELDQLDDLANRNSVLFKDAKWKILFSNDFKTSFGKLKCSRMKKQVLNLLLKLSNGWRPKSRSIDLHCKNSLQIIKQFKVEELYIICTIDIIKEFKYVQILKVWNVLSLEEIPKMTKRLESIFSAYTDDYVNRCTEKCVDGNLELPRSWAASEDIIRFRKPSKCEGESEVSDGRSYVENSKVSESLLLMKFYSLSSGVVNHLLSESEVDLPMEVTDEQMDIISFSKSSFIIGRSGTGKTTILTTKLFQNEQNIRVASEGVGSAESSHVQDTDVIDGCDESKPTVLRQLFVTVSPKLCYAVKQQVSQHTSDARNGNSTAENNLDDADCITSEFSDIPNTFIGIPVKSYPLIITFHKFLMMLDGTSGNSFFERFLEAKEGSHGDHISSRSIAMQTFIRLSEVTYDRFCSLYWPHFNSNLTKNLDPSRVFTEIISYIKGGVQAGGSLDGKLSNEAYSLLSEGRTSTLTREKREMVYTLFQAYEKMKTKRGEFDLGDFVNDIHRRFENSNYEGDQIDFVYIDEVQDLSIRQISLFKYICQNVDEGFIFAGDTAQTIARGIDFRFQDIRSLFYKEFLSNKTNGKQEKGLVSEIFQLKQNFRTHVGVLELAQSVVDILYCYFAHAIDKLEPETSLISGEAPVILESGNDENAIVTIFGDSVTGEDIVGFGAEQVILVRDESAKTEICKYVGKHALVLTIVECKGLEFQDVFLFNFFGSSPLKEQWRLIYGYMKERDWLDEKYPHAFPSFSEERHYVLCSELKQLYVAITRTRQRLWICEHREEMSKPMFDYWKKRGLVQVRKLDDSVAQAMRVASSPQEWRERGKKLFYENNFVMATMCFERAGDTKWEKLAKASGLRASAQQMLGTNSEAAFGYLRDAGDMFESIGKHDSAATCYCDLGNYKRAAQIYLDKCGRPDAAAECFLLAKCYSDAAEAYASGNQFSSCLSVCKKVKLYDEAMRYLEYWKEHAIDKMKEIEHLEQDFLESCALDYHDREDNNSMMKYVRAFCTMESKRVFLRSIGCLDYLLVLEEEAGNFLDAAKLVRSWGDALKEAEFLEKAGQHDSAATCYCDSGNYKRAAQIYLDKCGRPDAAAECFLLAKCYSEAAEVYATKNQFSNCLSVCKKGKLYDEGMRYLEYWKEHVIDQRKEIEQIEQEFLESCAQDYHERKDNNSMMKYVRAFCTMESKRVFLRSIGCLDDLLGLEEESGNFLDAAKLVRSWGDVLKEAEFLEKAGQHGDAALLLVLYVFFSSLWGKGNEGWPLKQFTRKEELCKKAESLADMGSKVYYPLVCSELKVLSNEESSLSELKRHLNDSQRHTSLRGEILTIRKLLDAHLCFQFSKYDLQDELPFDTKEYVDDKISHNRVSAITLIFYWNMWKANVVKIFESLKSLEFEELNKHAGHVDFTLSYFGVRKQCVNANTIYLLVKKDADWLRNAGDFHRDGKIVTLDLKRLVFAMRSYWQSELQCVGMKVLETLEGLHKAKTSSKSSVFQQNISLVHMFEVSKFLLDCKYLNLAFNHKDRVATAYFNLVFPLDWRKSISKDLIPAREINISPELLEDIIDQEVNSMGELNYCKIGKVVMICLSSRNPIALNEQIFNRLQWNRAWGSFFEILCNRGLNDVYVTGALQNALDDTYRANWRLPNYISPHSFVYLLDYLSFRVSSSVEVFFTAKSSFVGWFMHLDLSASKPIFPEAAIRFLVATVKDILYNKSNTVSWIERSGIDYSYYLPLLALKLVMILSLICLQVPADCSRTLLDLLTGSNNIAYLLPRKFVSPLLRRRKGCYLNLDLDMVAEAFMSVEDPLVIGSSVDPRIYAPCAIFVDLARSREEIMSDLFPNLHLNPMDGCEGVAENES